MRFQNAFPICIEESQKCCRNPYNNNNNNHVKFHEVHIFPCKKEHNRCISNFTESIHYFIFCNLKHNF